jgi:hypothetical protein
MTRNLQQLQNHADQLEILTILAEWGKKSDNKELQALQMAMYRQMTYISGLEGERFTFDRIISEAISDKHRALARAQKAEEDLNGKEDPLVVSINKKIEFKEMLSEGIKKISKKY